MARRIRHRVVDLVEMPTMSLEDLTGVWRDRADAILQALAERIRTHANSNAFERQWFLPDVEAKCQAALNDTERPSNGYARHSEQWYAEQVLVAISQTREAISAGDAPAAAAMGFAAGHWFARSVRRADRAPQTKGGKKTGQMSSANAREHDPEIWRRADRFESDLDLQEEHRTANAYLLKVTRFGRTKIRNSLKRRADSKRKLHGS